MRLSSRSAISPTESTLACAAARLDRERRPSSSRQIRATVVSSSAPTARSRRTAWPRSRKRRAHAYCSISSAGAASSGVASGSSAKSTSPVTPSGTRLVASMRTSGHCRRTSSASAAHPLPRARSCRESAGAPSARARRRSIEERHVRRLSDTDDSRDRGRHERRVRERGSGRRARSRAPRPPPGVTRLRAQASSCRNRPSQSR